jgi:predicted ABC-class ATPase
MSDNLALDSLLRKLDGKSYKAYREIKGSYNFPNFRLIIDHLQSDPFASPSKLRVQISQSIAKFSSQLYNSPSRKIALKDYLARQFAKSIQKIALNRGSGKSGLISIASTKQEVLQRNSVLIDDRHVEVRFLVGLPARGRTILGYQAIAVLCEDIPKIVESSLFYENLDPQKIEEQIKVVEDADYIRQQLSPKGLVAFIANGAILPRRSGVDARRLGENAIPFQSPPSIEVEFDCPNYGKIQGMGIGKGITLIVGGGYQGKSTLLRAIELGIYHHIPGDGREFVVTNPSAVKIRAEDGRSIVGVNISAFINQLPQGKSTANFSTTNASGSTSQAANIIEALEMGSDLLLIDEDTAATNFMIRDYRMQQLISKEKEPITPFIDKIRQLYTEHEISTILVMGGSGDYFEVADRVIAMDNFKPEDLTAKAKNIAQQFTNQRLPEGSKIFGPITSRIPLEKSIDPSRGRKDVTFKVRDVNEIILGKEDIDLSAVEQIVDSGQLKAIASAIVYAKRNYINNQRTLAEILDLIMKDINQKGLDILTDFIEGDLVLFRRFELASAINRIRSLQVKI